MRINDVVKMADSSVPRGVFATVINNEASSRANLPVQTLVTTVRVPAVQEVRVKQSNCVAQRL